MINITNPKPLARASQIDVRRNNEEVDALQAFLELLPSPIPLRFGTKEGICRALFFPMLRINVYGTFTLLYTQISDVQTWNNVFLAKDTGKERFEADYLIREEAKPTNEGLLDAIIAVRRFLDRHDLAKNEYPDWRDLPLAK